MSGAQVATIDQVLSQELHRTACGSFLGAAFPGCAGNVQMCPGVAAGEVLEKAGGRDAAACAPTDILQVGEVGFQ